MRGIYTESRCPDDAFSGLAVTGGCPKGDPPLFPSRLRRQVAHSDQVVGRRGEGEHPVHPLSAPVPCLPHQPHGLHPAEDFLDPFSFPHTDRVAGMACCSRVDGTIRRILAREVWGDLRCPEQLHEPSDVIPLVSSQRGAIGAGD